MTSDTSRLLYCPLTKCRIFVVSRVFCFFSSAPISQFFSFFASFLRLQHHSQCSPVTVNERTMLRRVFPGALFARPVALPLVRSGPAAGACALPLPMAAVRFGGTKAKPKKVAPKAAPKAVKKAAEKVAKKPVPARKAAPA